MQSRPSKVRKGGSLLGSGALFMGMSYHHASARPRRDEQKRAHPAELTGFILLTVRAICTTNVLW